jgi:hypothetical protein
VSLGPTEMGRNVNIPNLVAEAGGLGGRRAGARRGWRGWSPRLRRQVIVWRFDTGAFELKLGRKGETICAMAVVLDELLLCGRC